MPILSRHGGFVERVSRGESVSVTYARAADDTRKATSVLEGIQPIPEEPVKQFKDAVKHVKDSLFLSG
jgi:hypothetical protein